MITSIQTVSNVATVSALPTLGQLFQVTQGGSSSPTIPSVIVTLGYSTPTPLTYDAAGQFESLLQMAGTSQDALGSTDTALGGVNTGAMADTLTAAGSAPDLNNLLFANVVLGTGAGGNGNPAGTIIATPTSAVAVPANNIDLTTQSTADAAILAESVANAATDAALAGTAASSVADATLAEIINATSAKAPTTSINPATASNTAALPPATPATAAAVPAAPPAVASTPAATPSATTIAAPAPAVSLPASGINPATIDDAAQALSNIAGNPAYAGMASTLYVSAMTYRSQLATAALTNAAGSPPVTAVRAVAAVTGEPKGGHR